MFYYVLCNCSCIFFIFLPFIFLLFYFSFFIIFCIFSVFASTFPFICLCCTQCSTYTLKPALGSLKVIGTNTYRSATYDFLLTFHSNHGPTRTVSEINGYFSRKSQNFPTPRLFCAPSEGVPLGIGYRRSVSKH